MFRVPIQSKKFTPSEILGSQAVKHATDERLAAQITRGRLGIKICRHQGSAHTNSYRAEISTDNKNVFATPQ
jgi:hypothetical protein